MEKLKRFFYNIYGILLFLVGSVLLIFLVFCAVLFVFFVFVLRLVYTMLPVSLDGPFLIGDAVSSNVRSIVKMDTSRPRTYDGNDKFRCHCIC